MINWFYGYAQLNKGEKIKNKSMAFVNHLVRLEIRLYYQVVNITAYFAMLSKKYLRRDALHIDLHKNHYQKPYNAQY